jgi:nucleotidyltransferase substrate binding protein (TIGR01987 family)
MQKIAIKFNKLEKALTALEAIYLKSNLPDRSNIDATIQRFEFTFELFWKTLREFFLQKGLEINFPKDVLKEAFSAGIITDETTWLEMLKDRNLTSHTYNEALADIIFANIKNYTPLIRKVVNDLASKL